MAIDTDIVARKYLAPVAATPVSVDIPATSKSDIFVYLSGVAELAVQDVDYTVTLNTPTYEDFIITPTASLRTKLDALVSAGGEDFIVVRRTLNYLSDLTAELAFFRAKIAQEFDKNIMRFHQLAEGVSRTVRSNPADVVALSPLPDRTTRAGKYMAFDGTGDIIATSNEGDAGTQTVVATGSVTPRLLSDRFANVLNILDWGAQAGDLGGSVATANTAAIMNAIDSLPSEGGSIYVPGGNIFRVGLSGGVGGIWLDGRLRDKSNVRIFGDGFSSVLKLDDDMDYNVIEAFSNGKFIIENLTLEGNWSRGGTQPVYTGGISTQDADASYRYRHGVYADNVEDISVRNVLVTDTSYHGLNIGAGPLLQANVDLGIGGTGSTRAHVSGVIAKNCGGGGITVAKVNEGSITGNLVYGSFEFGLDLEKSHGLVVTGNTIKNIGSHGVYLYGLDNCSISGNHVEDCDDFGILIDGAAKQVSVVGNNIKGNADTYSGIHVTQGYRYPETGSWGATNRPYNGLSIIGNNVHGCQKTGGAGIRVTFNTLGSLGNPAYTEGDAGVISIVGNQCHENKDIGIDVIRGAGVVVSGNTATLNGVAGVRFQTAFDGVCNGNVCNDNGVSGTGYGIWISDASARVIVDANQCRDTGQSTATQTHGLYVDGTASPTIGLNLLGGTTAGSNVTALGHKYTSTYAELIPESPNAAASLRLTAKGAADVQLWNGTNLLALFQYIASAVNYLTVQPSATGTGVVLAATGTDTDIDLNLVPKGAGKVSMGAWTSNADAAVNGYVTIKDASGNTRKLATIA